MCWVCPLILSSLVIINYDLLRYGKTKVEKGLVIVLNAWSGMIVIMHDYWINTNLKEWCLRWSLFPQIGLSMYWKIRHENFQEVSWFVEILCPILLIFCVFWDIFVLFFTHFHETSWKLILMHENAFLKHATWYVCNMMEGKLTAWRQQRK